MASKIYSHSSYTVGWVCALRKELTAAVSMLDEKHPDLAKQRNDHNIYTLGRINEHNVVVACLPMIGTNNSAAVVSQMILTFPSIKFCLMVGIGGGVPPKVRLGDVVVSQPVDGFGGVVQWDFGRAEVGGHFERKGQLNSPPKELLAALAKLETKHEMEGSAIPTYLEQLRTKYPRLAAKYLKNSLEDILFKSSHNHRERGDIESNNENGEGWENDEEVQLEDCHYCDRTQLVKRPLRSSADERQIHYGLVASGNQAIADAARRNEINKLLDGNVLCFEMEAAGIMNDLPCLVIRGICDYCDSHKNTAWQEHAAAVAAAYAKEVLSVVIPEEVQEMPTVRSFCEAIKEVTDAVNQVSRGVDILVDANTDEERHRILSWLTPVDYGLQQNDFLARRHPGTGEWLLNTTEFSEWVSRRNQTLLCTGIPGSGKTIITSIAIDHLLRTSWSDENIAVAYVYCSFKSRDEQQAIDLLLTLLKQLVQKRNVLPDIIKSLHAHHNKERTRPSLSEISKVLRDVASNYSRTYILIDALDECQAERQEFLKEVLSLQAQAAANIFATSRPVHEIQSTFKDCMKLEIRAREEDIRSYVRKQVSRLNVISSEDEIGGKEDLQDEVTNTITDIVDGMFLLAQLFMKYLEDKTTITEMKSAVQDLRRLAMRVDGNEKAKILDGAYAQAMDRINCQLQGFRKLALAVLSWIICAKRSLTTFELQEALAVEGGKSKLDRENIPRLDIMISVCAGLVTIDEQSHTIRLVHYTAQEYFRHTQQRWFPNAEGRIAETCLTYLSFGEFERGPSPARESFEQRLRSNQFYDYAARYWGHHARHANIEPEDSIHAFLQRQKNLLASSQVMFAPKFRDEAPKVPDNFTELHVAANFGLLKTTAGFLASGYHSGIEDSSYRTPVSYAAQNGHEAIVAFLLKAASPDENSSPRQWARTPLSYAAEGGHLAVVIMLLESSIANDNNLKEWNLSEAVSDAVCRAAEKGHKTVIEWLLKKFKDEINNAHTRIGLTPLAHAAGNGHEAVVELLLKNGDIRTQPQRNPYCSPMYCAVRNGHEALAMKLLLPLSGYSSVLLTGAVANGNLSLFTQLLKFATEQPNYTDRWLEIPFFEAIRQRQPHITKFLLETGKMRSVYSPRFLGEAVLLCAKRGDSALFHSLFEVNNILLDTTDSSGRTALSYAAETGGVRMVKTLLERGPSEINRKDTMRKMPIIYAITEGHEDVALQFLETGKLDTRPSDEWGRSILSYAAEQGQLQLLEVVLKKMKVNPDTDKSSRGLTPLMFAAGNGHLQATRLLLRGGAQVHLMDYNGQTPFIHAAKNGHDNVFQLILEQSVTDPHVLHYKDDKGHTALSHAAKNGHHDVVNRLLGFDESDPNSRTTEKHNSGRTPLSFAAATGHAFIVQSFVSSNRVDVAIMDDQGRTALSYAAENGFLEVLKILIGTGMIDPDQPDIGTFNGGRTPLWYAAKNGHTAIVKYLLNQHSVNVNAIGCRNDNGKTPLTWAAENGHEEIVAILVNTSMVNLDARASHAFNNGRTPLSFAAENGHISTIEFLLQKREIEPDAIDQDGQTPLSWAAKTGHSSVVELLLRTGRVLVDRKDRFGQTPLFYAAGSRHSIMVRLLLDTGKADANAVDSFGRTPLFPAAARGFVTAVNLLLRKGRADPNHTDAEGRTPIWFAKGRAHNNVVRILREAGAAEPVCEDAPEAPSSPIKGGEGRPGEVPLPDFRSWSPFSRGRFTRD